METEDLHTLVEVEQAFSEIVQAEELFVSAINFVNGDAALFHLVIESLAQAWADVEKRKKTRGIKAAAVSEAGADQMIIVRRNCLEYMQHCDRLLEHQVRAPDQAGRVEKISLFDVPEYPLKVECRALHQQFGSLVNHNKCR